MTLRAISFPFGRGAYARPGAFLPVAVLLASLAPAGRLAADPLDDVLRAARESCRRDPRSVAALDRLAALELRAYRATHAAETLAAARAAVDRALAISPGDFDARRCRAAIGLVDHRFADVEREAGALRSERPDDADLLGMIADSQMETGRYDEALGTIQEMVDRRPGLPAYSRVSYAREIAGDLPGALRAMDMAIDAGNPSDPEGIAWCVARSGLLCWKLGRIDEAARRFEAARSLYPRSPYAWEGLGWIAEARGDGLAAARAFEKAFEIVPWPQYAVERAELAGALGRGDDARRWSAIVRAIGDVSAPTGLFNRVLALWEADHGDAARAVAMAEDEIASRKDVYGWDALAWALYRDGRTGEAADAARRALARGTRDPMLEAHAGIILSAAGDASGAIGLLRSALHANPAFSPLLAGEATRRLQSLASPVRAPSDGGGKAVRR